MVWRRIGDKPLSELMLSRFTDIYMRHYRGRWVNSCRAEFILGNINIYSAPSMTCQHWYGVGSCNPSPWKARNRLFSMVNRIVADNMSTLGASASVDMCQVTELWLFCYLVLLSYGIGLVTLEYSASAPEGLRWTSTLYALHWLR